MSRPPRPYPAAEVSGGLPVRDGKLRAFAPSFQSLVELQVQLSQGELGQLPPGGEGDFALTLFGASALVAHVLGVYQDFYGGEAFLQTARTEQSLVRHGRRIGYTSDPGVAATGVIAVDVKAGLAGTLGAGLPLLSVPRGQQKAQSYETLDARAVDAGWNQLELADSLVELHTIAAGASSLELRGVGFGIEPGEVVVLAQSLDAPETFDPHVLTVLVVTVRSVSEDAVRSTTALGFAPALPLALGSERAPLANYRLLAKPSSALMSFGWDADPRIFPPEALRRAGRFTSGTEPEPDTQPLTAAGTVITTTGPIYGYDVAEGVDAADIYLAVPLAQSLLGQWLLRIDGANAAVSPLFVEAESTVSVAFVREERQVVQVAIPVGDSIQEVAQHDQLIPQWISASTSKLRLRAAGASDPVARSDHDVHSRWLAAFELAVAIETQQPDRSELIEGRALALTGAHGGLEPGMLLVISTRDRRVAQLVELTSVEVVGDRTLVTYSRRGTTSPAHAFTRDDAMVLGNVIRVSHGKAVDEVLGDSDGVTPFLRFTLKKSPVTHLPDANGAIPVLEVRVADVLWAKVTDFSGSGAEDRHYVIQRDEAQAVQIVFGDGRRGAVPPAGKRHVRARYRVGLGVIGNLEAGQLSRLEKAHPLVALVHNPVPISNGTEPAGLEQVRLEATRFIRTFDRAVSSQDYADLALLFPGVARARATSSPALGVELVVADADGNPLGDQGPLLSFLDARRDRETPLRFRDPEAVPITLSVSVEHDPAFFDWQVERAVREALTGSDERAPGLFTFRGRQLGDPEYLSRVYAAVNAAPGVVFSAIVHFDLAPDAERQGPAPRLRDAIRVAPHEWLKLAPAQLQVKAAIRRSE